MLQEIGRISMILTISNREIQEMQMAARDDDKDEALRLVKGFLNRLEQQKQQGMTSHPEG
jgi:hypothetical protein